jgi:hypothetical protein
MRAYSTAAIAYGRCSCADNRQQGFPVEPGEDFIRSETLTVKKS